MEETDGIITDNLRKLGCDIDDDVTSLAHFTTEIVIEGVVRCLVSINPDFQLNHRMPPNLPARYKLCMEIAKACKDVGIKGDLGYETFLHGSQAEIRKVFVILIQKLPKVNEQPITDSSADPFQHTLKQIRNEMLSQLHQPWLPYFCNNPQEKQLLFQTMDLPNKANNSKALSQLAIIPSAQFTPSLIENHNSELAADKYKFKLIAKQGCQKIHSSAQQRMLPVPNSRFSLIRLLQYSDIEKIKKKPQPPPKPAHLGGSSKSGTVLPTIEEQCQQLNLDLEKLEHNVMLRQTELADITEEIINMKTLIDRKETEQNNQKKELERQEKLYALLPEAQSHLNRMEKLLETNHEKMVLLEEQWLEIKKPFEDKFKEWEERHENSETEKLKASLELVILSLRQVVEEIRTKEDTIETLQSNLDSLPSSSLTRTFYTQRILSIVANVKKQNEEMNRVLEDVKSVQREINSVQGKVERTFTVTDEIIFRMAKSDETARRIYKYLISLHTDCNDILSLVKESGNLSREIKDLEEQAETELRKNVVTKLRRLQSDLEQIRSENQSLEQRIQSNST